MNGLLFITHCTDKFTYLESVEIALKGGCRQIQLRMKEAAPAVAEHIGWEAKRLCDAYDARLFIDDRVDVCKSIGAAGVHLGKLDMPPSDARKLLGDRFIIGGTANTFEDIHRLSACGVDYVGLGPFRFTATKKNLSPILGIAGYREIISRCRECHIQLPVFAIGGITIDDIPELMDTGISGIALSSTILNAGDPVKETQRIMNLINTYQK